MKMFFTKTNENHIGHIHSFFAFAADEALFYIFIWLHSEWKLPFLEPTKDVQSRDQTIKLAPNTGLDS